MWEQTDELQFVRKSNEDDFEVIETLDVAGEFYVVDNVYVDLEDYDLEEEVSAYYESLEEIKTMYKDGWKQIVAEIIAENEASLSGGVKLETYEDVVKYLESEYKITVN